MMLPVWTLAVGVCALADAQHVTVEVRGSAEVAPGLLRQVDGATRRVLADKLGSQLLQPPDAFPDAAEHRKQGEKKMATAKEKAGMLETADAMVAAEAAVKEFEQGAVTLEGVRLLADAHAFAMIACGWNGKQAEAEEHARHNVLLGGSLKAHQALATPEDDALFKKVTRSVQSQPKGSLEVSSKPAGATVMVDGKNVGVTPVSLKDVLPGAHLVQVTSPWREAFSAEAMVPGGGPGTVEAVLQDLPGISGIQAALEKDPLLERAGDWRSAAMGLGADHAVVVAVQADKGGQTLRSTAHLYNLKDGSRRRRVQKQLNAQNLDADVAALVTDLLNVGEGAGVPGGAQMVLTEAPAATSVASSAGGGGGPGVMMWLPWVVLAGAVPVALLVGTAGGLGVGVAVSAYYWQDVVNSEVAAAQATHARRNAARSTTLGF